MSADILSLVWRKAPYSGNTLLVLLALADWSDDSGICRPAIDKLAARSRQTRKECDMACRRFEKDGYLLMQSDGSYCLQLSAFRAGVTHIEKKQSLAPEAPTGNGNSVHSKVKNLIAEACQTNKVPFVWDGSDAKALYLWLNANGNLEFDTIKQMVINRVQSDVPLGERPRIWIPNLAKYAEGPLDRFGKVKKVRL